MLLFISEKTAGEEKDQACTNERIMTMKGGIWNHAYEYLVLKIGTTSSMTKKWTFIFKHTVRY